MSTPGQTHIGMRRHNQDSCWMRRRELMALLAAAISWSLGVYAQEQSAPLKRIGIQLCKQP
jgi:hypothetical protein